MTKFFHKGFLIVAMLFVAVTYTGAYFSSNVAISDMSFSTGIWNPGRATITEVLYDPASPPVDTGREWIEITNTGGYVLDMTGYIMHVDGMTSTYDFVFPTFNLIPGAKVVVHPRTTSANTSTDLYWPDTGGVGVGNTDGSVGLFRSLPKEGSTMVDFVQYGAGDRDGEEKAKTAGIWTEDDFVADVVEGHSIQLISADNNSSAGWFDQSTPNPGA